MDVTDDPVRYPGGWRPIRYADRCRQRTALLAQALADAVDVARSRDDVVCLLVFGSYARGEVTPWSDLDLVVVAGDAPGAVTAIYARGALGDVIGVPSDDWRRRLQRNPFGETILREAREVYARPQA